MAIERRAGEGRNPDPPLATAETEQQPDPHTTLPAGELSMGKKGRDQTTEETQAEEAARERGYGEGFREGARAVADKAARELRRYSDD